MAAKAFREACTELAKKLALALGSKATSLRVSKKPDFHGFFPKSAYTLFGSFQLSPNNLTAEETSLKLKKTFMPLGFTGRGFVPFYGEAFKKSIKDETFEGVLRFKHFDGEVLVYWDFSLAQE